jgi:hypothetical protein
MRALTTSTLAALLVALAPAAARAAPEGGLLGPARCVSDWLEELAAAARPRPPAGRARPDADEARFARVRALLAPAAQAKLDRDPRHPLAAWRALGAGGAFLGYELVRVRRAPAGAAVVVARERTARAPDASPTVSTCTYLAAPVGDAWRVVDRRCGRDFGDAEVVAQAGGWDPPPSTVLTRR